MRRLILCAFAVFGLPAGAMAQETAELGEKVFRRCGACHSLEAGARKGGPDLAGIVGRPVASVEGYDYSDAMLAFAEGGKVWDEETLATYITAPRETVPGTNMAFSGLRKREDVDNLIAFLKQAAK
jgi:cytochrome c